MKKKLFHNYEFELDKNEAKVLSSFARQAVNQMEMDDKYAKEVKLFNSITSKLSTLDSKVKFTKDEKTRLTFQLSENIKHLQNKTDNAWFLTRWFYKNMLNQYNSLYSKMMN